MEVLPFVRAILGVVVLVGGTTAGVMAASRALRVSPAPALTVFFVLSTIAGVLTATVGPYVFEVTDAIVYDRQAAGVAQFLTGVSGPPFLIPGKEAVPIMLGTVYTAFGHVPLLGLVMNAALVAFTTVFLARAARYAVGEVSPYLLVIAVLACPIVLLYGPSLMREPLAWLGTAMLAAGVADALTRRVDGYLVAGLGGLLLYLARPSLGVAVIVATAAALVAVRLIARRRFVILGIVTVAAGAVLYFFGPAIVSFIFLSPRLVEGNIAELADAVTGFTPPPRYPGAIGMLVSSLLGLPRAVLGPVPMELGPEPVWLWVLANSLYWLTLIGLVIGRRTGRWDARAIFAACALVSLLGVALTLGNYGIVVRMRGTAIFFLIPLVVAPLRSRWPSGIDAVALQDLEPR